MSKVIVFKQWYKPRNIPSTRILNGKHLIYIATRKGAIRNPDCAFGLWGRLPGQRFSENIDDLRYAHRTITDASRHHTIYRAILSVDADTAKQHDLYERKTWQELIDAKITILAKEMDIERKAFCWVASMHYEKNHPHVHIMYWDNSTNVRQEHIPDKRFDIMSEHVRAEFGREIFREELSQHRSEVKRITDLARLNLQAMCRETNLADALNLRHISDAKLDELGDSLLKLTLALPTKGALKYAYLPKDCKEQMSEFLDSMMKITDFHLLRERYIKLTTEISEFYGNGESAVKHHVDKAINKLYTDLGNTILGVLKEYRNEICRDTPPTSTELLQAVVRSRATAILQQSKSYQELWRLFPQRRTPLRTILSDKTFSDKKREVVKEIRDDLRIRTQIDGYLREAVKDLPGGFYSGIKLDAPDLWRKEYGDAGRAIDEIIISKLQEDAGYAAQQKADMALNLLLRLFKEGSQGANQIQSRRDLHRRRELSKTAQRDRQKQKEQEGNWTNEL